MTEYEPEVTTYNSTEEMLTDMKNREERANEMVLAEQKGISYGDYFIRAFPEGGFFVFGRVLTEEELKQGEIDAGADENEAAYIMRGKRSSYERGYRTGMCYSKVEPDGEYGDTHVLNVWPITMEDFELARERGWDPHPLTLGKVSAEMQVAADREGFDL